MRRHDFAILGFGNVGRALARHVDARRASVLARFGLELRLTGVIDRGGAVLATDLPAEAIARWKEEGRPLASWPGARPVPSPEELRELGVAAVVLALPTDLERGEPGLAFARRALDAGLDVVLADEGPALFALPELEELASCRARFLGTSGTTGSALPSLSVLRDWFAGSSIDEISGILNGTSNLILTRLREPGVTCASALEVAQREGIAEPDPRLDLSGFDTAIKLVILARGLIDRDAALADVERRGITDLPPELLARSRRGPERLRLIGRASRDGTRARITVSPELVAPGNPFFDVDGAHKAIRFRGADLGEMTLVGGASSRTGTAWALLRDLIAAARARSAAPGAAASG